MIKKNLIIYLVSGAHFDLGWCGTPGACFARGDEIIRMAMDAIMGKYPDYRFTIEYVYFMRHFLKRYPQYQEKVLSLLKEGKIEICASMTGMMEHVLDGEALVQQVIWAKRWAKETLGVNLVSCQLTDCPGHTAQLPQVLAKSGVSYLSYSRYSPPVLLHYWQGLDGSKVLAANHVTALAASQATDFGYCWGVFTVRKGFEEAAKQIPSQLKKLQSCWPTGVILMMDELDLLFPDPKVCKVVKQWNEHYENKMKMGTISEFFYQVESEKAHLPTYRGEMPYAWYKAVAEEADLWLKARSAENILLAASKFCSLAEMLNFGKYNFDDFIPIWECLFHIQDHNIAGRHGEIHNRIRCSKAEEAFSSANILLEEATSSIAENVSLSQKGSPIVVFNPLSWEREEIMESSIDFLKRSPEFKNFFKLIEGLIDKDLAVDELPEFIELKDVYGKETPVQIIKKEDFSSSIIDDTLKGPPQRRISFLFSAKKVPSLGYSTYYLLPSKKSKEYKSSLIISKKELENKFYYLKIVNGCIETLRWKEKEIELIPPKGELFNDVVVLEDVASDVDEELTGKKWKASENEAKVEIIESGPLRAKLLIKRKILNSFLTQQIILYDELPRIDLNTQIDWEGKKNTQVRLCYPFSIPKGKITYEVPYGAVSYSEDEIPGTYRGSGARVLGKWIDISNDKHGVTLTGHSGTYSLEHKRGTIFPILFSTCYSCGNSFLFSENKGRHTFGFSIMAHESSWREAHIYRHGWQYNNPLIIGFVPNPIRKYSSSLKDGYVPVSDFSPFGHLRQAMSFCKVDKPNVIITSIAKAYKGKGWIIRLFETEGIATSIELKFAFPIGKAWEMDLLENKLRQLECKGKSISLSVTSFGIHTLRLIPGN